MSTNLGDFQAALRMRDLMKRISHAVVNRERPGDRYATVVAVDTENSRVQVTYVESADTPVWVPLSPMRIPLLGDIVRVEGMPGDRHVAMMSRRIGRGLIPDGYAERVTSASAITTAADVAGLAVTVDLAPDRIISITAEMSVINDTADQGALLSIQEDETVLQNRGVVCRVANRASQLACSVKLFSPAGGEHTYKLTLAQYTGGNVTLSASATSPAFIIVEDIGGDL